MILDDDATLEAYPIFDDLANPTTSPRLIDLRRMRETLVGEVHRRYTQGATVCDAKSQIHVLACVEDRLDLVLADPLLPVSFTPCRWVPMASHREIWQHD